MGDEDHGIRGSIAHLAVPIEQLVPYPGNAKEHDLPTLRDSLRKHGQYKPVVVQRATGYVLAGNGTLAAAGAEGWTHLAAVYLDCDDDTARRINLVDNRAQELGGYDSAALAALLEPLTDTADMLAGTGYDLDDIDALLAQAEPFITPAGTDAAWAETDEQTAARADQLSAHQRKADAGLAELILVLPADDHHAFGQLVDQVRGGLGDQRAGLHTGQVALGALRAVAALLERNDAADDDLLWQAFGRQAPVSA